MVNYAVTTSEAAVLWVAVDDRWASYTTDGSGGEPAPQVFESQLELVELITHTWGVGLFADTGMDIFIHESDTTDRPMSVFATQVEMAAGTYDFKLNPTGQNFHIIGAVPEPMTLTLLGLGGLALVRRKRKM